MDPKRLVDLALAVPALVMSLPVQAVVALAVRLRLGRPVLFRQQRPGLHGLPFMLFKFRTMRPVDLRAGVVSDADRLTPLGSFLRSTSLDELPSLWNVVRGDMSIVGPRPLLTQYLSRYTTTQARRHEVRPGLTGLAQVSGRNAVSWEERLQLDVTYVELHTLRGDLDIIARTIGAVLRRQGISAAGHDTMPEFTGSPSRDQGDEA
ncbi:MAG TPA: sugar transferase [Dermatophilaceae bacterium]|nr:sugar transferase [Dermatophilaceae bacterium]